MSVSIGGRLASRPTFRGLPVPFITAYREGRLEGHLIPDFRTHDAEKRVQCVTENLCQLCGQELTPQSVFPIFAHMVENRRTGEPPCHGSCADDAARLCPFLLGSSGYRESGAPLSATQVWHEPPPERLVDRIALYRTAEWIFDPARTVFYLGDPITVRWIDRG